MKRPEASPVHITGFGIGQISSGLFFTIMMTYLMYFYTNFMGIPVEIAGAVFMTARIIDAVTDPLLGVMADRTNSRYGKYRPYLMVGAPLCGMSLVLMFWAPELSTDMKIVYAYTTYILVSLARTICDTPYHSIVTLLSSDPDQRSRIIGIKNLIGVIGGLLGSAAVLPIIEYLGNDVYAWRTLAIAYGIIVTIGYWTCAYMLRSFDVYIEERTGEDKNKEESKKKHVPINEQLKSIYKNKAMLSVLATFASDQFAGAIVIAVNVYFFLYNVGSSGALAWSQALQWGAMIFAALTVKDIVKRFGKRRVALAIAFLLIWPSLALLYIPYDQVGWILFAVSITKALMVYSFLIAWTMLPDCADYAKVTMGLDGAATVTSTFTFLNKTMQAVGVFCGGLILAHFGFVEGAETQSAEAMDAILYSRVWFPIGGYIVSVLAMFYYPITREVEVKMKHRVEEIRNDEREGRTPTLGLDIESKKEANGVLESQTN